MKEFLGVAKCQTCGNNTPSFYNIQFYFLPSKLRRKRHRDRERQVFYCRECFEKTPTLSVAVGGQPFSPVKNPRDLEKTTLCLRCGEGAVKPDQLYGLLACTLLVRGSAIESRPLAAVCAACGEGHPLEIG